MSQYKCPHCRDCRIVISSAISSTATIHKVESTHGNAMMREPFTLLDEPTRIELCPHCTTPLLVELERQKSAPVAKYFRCAACRGPVRLTPSGYVCDDGHVGTTELIP